MPTGRTTAFGGGVFAEADVRRAGDTEWANLTGLGPGHPLISPGGLEGGTGFSTASERRIVTTPQGQQGPADTGGVMAVPDGAVAGLNRLDSWRDLFNVKGSPMPWLLLITLGVLVFAQLSIKARAGAFGRQATAAAALG